MMMMSKAEALAALEAGRADGGWNDEEADRVMRAMVIAGHIEGHIVEGQARYLPTASGIIYAISLMRLAGADRDRAFKLVGLSAP